MTYPQNPYGQQPVAGSPYGQPGARVPSGFTGRPTPSPATAIIAAVLAILGGLWSLVLVIVWIVALAYVAGDRMDLTISLIAQLILHAVAAGTLLVGAIMIFMKQTSGRMLVVIGCGVVLCTYVVGILLQLFGNRTMAGVFGGGPILLLFMVPAVATLVLALLPATKQYLGHAAGTAGRQPAYGQPGPGYPQHPGGYGAPSGLAPPYQPR